MHLFVSAQVVVAPVRDLKICKKCICITSMYEYNSTCTVRRARVPLYRIPYIVEQAGSRALSSKRVTRAARRFCVGWDGWVGGRLVVLGEVRQWALVQRRGLGCLLELGWRLGVEVRCLG